MLSRMQRKICDRALSDEFDVVDLFSGPLSASFKWRALLLGNTRVVDEMGLTAVNSKPSLDSGFVYFFVLHRRAFRMDGDGRGKTL